MQRMLAISEFHADGSFPNPKLDKFRDTGQPDFASQNLEAAILTSFLKEKVGEWQKDGANIK